MEVSARDVGSRDWAFCTVQFLSYGVFHCNSKAPLEWI